MTKFVLSLVAAALTTAAVAAPPAPAQDAPKTEEFTRDGITYVATSTFAANGDRIIAGYVKPNGRTFLLRVAKGRVRGNFAGQAVSYDLPMSSR